MANTTKVTLSNGKEIEHWKLPNGNIAVKLENDIIYYNNTSNSKEIIRMFEENQEGENNGK